MKIATHYDNLQVARNASPEVIRAAYKSLTQRYHPDRNPNDRARGERVMKIINQAYEVLSDPDRRREHDAWIAREEAAASAANAHDEAPRHEPPAPERPTPAQRPTAPAGTTPNYAAAAEAFRASRMHGGAASPGIDTTMGAARADSRPVDDRTESVPPGAGIGRNDKGARPAATPPSVASTAPEPGRLLYALILLLKFGGVLTGLVLYGKLSSLNASVRPEFMDAWGIMKLHLWLVWGIAVVAYFTAGELLASRRVRSTRWTAAGLIWAGAILAPLVGLLIAPIGLPHELAVKMPAYYVPKAIRGILFAMACTLYLGLSRRVKRTYVRAPPWARQATRDGVSGTMATDENVKGQATAAAREYWGGAGWSAFVAVMVAVQINPADHVGVLPTWAVPYARVGVWIAGIACVLFVIAALATKWRAPRG